MTHEERQQLRRSISDAKRSRVRSSGGWESDEQRQETFRKMESRLRAEYERKLTEETARLESVCESLRGEACRLELLVHEREVETDALRVRCDALESQRDAARKGWREAESWIQMAYGNPFAKPPSVPQYGTEEARKEARRRTWRESKRRAKLRKAWASEGKGIAA